MHREKKKKKNCIGKKNKTNPQNYLAYSYTKGTKDIALIKQTINAK